MFKKIRAYFVEVRHNSYRAALLSACSRKDLAHLLREIDQLQCDQVALHKAILESIHEVAKRVSSIELELLMARGACLDNNFEGKQDL